MKIVFRTLLTTIAVLASAGCATRPRPITDTAYQVSTIDALLAGAYQGTVECGELLARGDTGIGTFDNLDGEMIVLNRRIYQIKTDGQAYRPPGDATTPFATVVEFSADQTMELNNPVDMSGFEAVVDQAAPDENTIIAIKARGHFISAKCRSVPAQKPPFPPLAEVVRQQAVFDRANFDGTIVGFRCPPFVKGVNVPGYHLHLLADDGEYGGHILDFKMENGAVSIDNCEVFIIQLPPPGTTAGLDLAKDRSKELEKVEK